VRIVDAAGEDVPAGEPGDVIVSNLVNDATVLLNYRLGDQAALLTERCACGRTLPRMTQPLGRLDDWILVGETRVHSQSVRTVFTDESEILQYQVMQRASRDFLVSLVTRAPELGAALERRIGERLRARLGEGVTVEVVRVHDLPRTARGKVRAIVSMSDASAQGSPTAVLS
jgi:phenylacetate-CoA ligase